jgi:hypothetical protein
LRGDPSDRLEDAGESQDEHGHDDGADESEDAESHGEPPFGRALCMNQAARSPTASTSRVPTDGADSGSQSHHKHNRAGRYAPEIVEPLAN